MFHLILIDVAACVALIMVAAFFMVRRWLQRTRRSLIPASWRRRAAAERAGQGVASRPVAVIPGLTAPAAKARRARRASRAARRAPATPIRPAAQPQQEAHAHPATQPMPAAMQAGTQPLPTAVQAEQGTQPLEAVPPGRPPRPVVPAEQATRAQQATQPPRPMRVAAAQQAVRPGGAGEKRSAEQSLNGPGAAPRERPRPARPATSAERIGSYYDEADRHMSDYLAELGWADEPDKQDPQ